MIKLGPLVALLLLISACASDSAGNQSTTQSSSSEKAEPYDLNARIAPNELQLESSLVKPGETLSILFPEEPIRGVHFVLERRQGDGWDLRYHLVSDWGGERDPVSFPADSEQFAVEDVGIGGPGPDVVLVPEVAEPGQYRICTGNMRENICATVTIEAA